MTTLILIAKILISIPFMLVFSLCAWVLKNLLRKEYEQFLDKIVSKMHLENVKTREDLEREFEIAKIRDQQAQRNEE